MTITFTELPSPLGELRVARRDARIVGLAFADGWTRVDASLAARFGPAYRPRGGVAPEVAEALRRYFDGLTDATAALALDPGGTPFQQAVWRALRAVPAGRTTFYGALARAIDAPKAARAVGAACGANPIWLAIPCHRAIGNDGQLTGYAGGLARKRWLLDHEGALPYTERPSLSNAVAFAQR
jgi:methylated-DNA-[protein]-cysteine S-methyltransferase